jgi:hypothetical protein
LTALAWHVADEVYKEYGCRLMKFSERNQRFYLRDGLIEFCKLLCREVEREQECCHLLIA